MTRLLWIGGLGLLWALATGRPTLTNLGIGMLLAYIVLVFAQRAPALPRTLERVAKAASLLLYFLWELVVSNIRVAIEVITPGYRMRPGVVGVRLDARTDFEIAMLANMITLTPGTMSVDVSEDRRILYIHGLYVEDRDGFERSIKEGFERRLLEVLR